MQGIRDLERVIRTEASTGVESHRPESYHWNYRFSAYIYIKGLDIRLSEGDLIIVFSQFGEVVDVHISRDRDTGEPRGFAWLAYEDQRSTILAIENMNGAELLGRSLFVDHADKYFFQHKINDPKKPTDVQDASKPTVSRFAALSGNISGVNKTTPDSNNNNTSGGEKKLNDILEFDSDSDYEDHRRFIWDYEAYYSDTEEENQYQELLREVENDVLAEADKKGKNSNLSMEQRVLQAIATLEQRQRDAMLKHTQRGSSYDDDSDGENDHVVVLKSQQKQPVDRARQQRDKDTREVLLEQFDISREILDTMRGDDHAMDVLEKLKQQKLARQQAQQREDDPNFMRKGAWQNTRGGDYRDKNNTRYDERERNRDYKS